MSAALTFVFAIMPKRQPDHNCGLSCLKGQLLQQSAVLSNHCRTGRHMSWLMLGFPFPQLRL